MFPEGTSLLNYRVERTVILNDITQDNNKVLEDDSNKTVKFHRLERRMEEAVSIFQSVVEAEQKYGGPHQKRPQAENKIPASKSKQGQGMDKAIKRQKWVEIQPIAVGVDAGEEACGKTSTKKEVICTGKKVYMPPLPYTYKETELSEDLNNGSEWVFRD